MNCKNCGKENDIGSKFCIACGQKFADIQSEATGSQTNEMTLLSQPGAQENHAVSEPGTPVLQSPPSYQPVTGAYPVSPVIKRKKSGKKIAVAIVAILLVVLLAAGTVIGVAALNNPKVTMYRAAKNFQKTNNGELVIKTKVSGESITCRVKYEFVPAEKKCNFVLSLPNELVAELLGEFGADADNMDIALYDGVLFFTDEKTAQAFGFSIDVSEIMAEFWENYEASTAAASNGGSAIPDLAALYEELWAKVLADIEESDPDGTLGLKQQFEEIRKRADENIDIAKVTEALKTISADVKTEEFWTKYMGYKFAEEGDSKVYNLTPDIIEIVEYFAELLSPALGDEAADALEDELDYLKDSVTDYEVEIEASLYITKGKFDRIEIAAESEFDRFKTTATFENLGTVDLRTELESSYKMALENKLSVEAAVNQVLAHSFPSIPASDDYYMTDNYDDYYEIPTYDEYYNYSTEDYGYGDI